MECCLAFVFIEEKRQLRGLAPASVAALIVTFFAPLRLTSAAPADESLEDAAAMGRRIGLA